MHFCQSKGLMELINKEKKIIRNWKESSALVTNYFVLEKERCTSETVQKIAGEIYKINASVIQSLS